MLNGPFTNFPNRFGVPSDLPIRGWTGGRVFFVDGACATELSQLIPSAFGARCFPTLGGANGALAALGGRVNGGDVIYVLPCHTENVSAADYFSHTGTAAGFSIVGLGQGTMRPVFNWNTALATWLIDTANVELANLTLNLAGDPAATTALTTAGAIVISAAGCRIVGCNITFGVDADQIVTVGILTTAAADDLDFLNNVCIGAVAAEITAAGTFLRLIGADRAHIANNYIAGALATDTDGLIETLTTLSANLRIHHNFIYAQGAGNTCCLDFGAVLACTGFLDWNQLVVDADGTSQAVAFTVDAANNLALGQNNFMVSNNNERGLIVGTATT